MTVLDFAVLSVPVFEVAVPSVIVFEVSVVPVTCATFGPVWLKPLVPAARTAGWTWNRVCAKACALPAPSTSTADSSEARGHLEASGRPLGAEAVF